MKRAAILLLVLSVGACVMDEDDPGSAQQGTYTSLDDDETAGRWFVELPSAPVASGGSRATLAAERKAFRDEAQARGVQYGIKATYEDLFNGYSVVVDDAGLAGLRTLASVKDLHPVIAMTVPETEFGSVPDLFTAKAMTGVTIAQSELGLTGAGIRVGIIDTGVDYHHVDLGGCFGAGCRVAVGHDFVGDAFDNAAVTALTPDEDPDDCNGHGTHVAGIAGASGEVTGVAPGVTFGAYRVFGCSGSTTADIMLAAMERAYADGMDVVNMSIGSAFTWPQYPTAKAADRLVQRGVVVVASAGNSGASGLYASSAPSLGSKVIAVASYENTHVRLRTFTISPDNQAIGYLQAAAAPAAPTSGTASLATTASANNEACAALPAASLDGKVAVIKRGSCSFYSKARRAQLAGATGVVLYNNVPGYISPTVAVVGGEVDSRPVTIPVVAILAADGATIVNRLAGGPVDLTWTDQEGSFPQSVGGLLASSSSYGPSPDLSFKPDLGAPGGNIYSTYVGGGYASLSGTSMASPHVAGAAALLLQARPNLPPALVRDLLQNTATPARWFGNPGLGFLDVIHRQGAGMVQVDRAALATTTVAPATLALGESEAGPATRTLTIRNTAATDLTYSFSHTGALSTGPNTFVPGFSAAMATVAFEPASVLVPAGGSAQVSVTITAPDALAARGVYGGYLVASAEGGNGVRVPYMGFKGDYQSITVLVPTALGFPRLARAAGAGYVLEQPGAVYPMGADIPFFLIHLDHQARRVRGEISAPATGKSFHVAFDEEYVPRNSTSTGFFAFPFDGTTRSGTKLITVPDGEYVLNLSVLKALGDPANPAHWETWTSPAFVIDRP